MARMELPDDWTQDEIRDFNNIVAGINAGMDQVIEGLNLPLIPFKRRIELAERIAFLGFDLLPHEAMAVGTWFASSARTQMMQEQAIKAARENEGPVADA